MITLNMKSVGQFLTAALFATHTGCIIVPFPNSRVEEFGVKSRLVDELTDEPIAGARVMHVGNGKWACTSNSDGDFDLKPHVQWHGGYLFGAISYPLFPFTHDAVPFLRHLQLSADGYEARQVVVSASNRRTYDDPRYVYARFEDDYLMVPKITMKRSPSPASQPAAQ